jgi:F-type H+-transporting ATPase subunit b
MLRLDINLVFTIINLLIIYFIIAKFLFKPIHNILDKRQQEIDKQYADAKVAADKADELKAQYEESIKGLAGEKEAVVNEAREKASAEYDRILSNAHAEADKLVIDAKKIAKAEQEKSIKQAKEQIAELVLEATSKVVASGQGSDADKELYNQFLAKTGEQQ